MKPIFAVVKRMLSSNIITFIITAAVVFCATTSGDSEVALSNGNYTWLAAAMAPFFIVCYDCKKLMYLGTSKKDYYLGSLMTYGILAVTISLVNTLIHLIIDPLDHDRMVVNLMELCGWTENGIVIAFFQQALFLGLVMIFLHVLLSMQPYWYGWVVDVILTAVICMFTPIVPLRQVLSGFFAAVMFNSNAPLHIAICASLSMLLAAVGLAVLKRKTL